MNIAVKPLDGRDGWNLPSVVSNMVDYPLYLTVAMWGLRLNKVITKQDVSQAFLISTQRASDILHYISHEGIKYVKSERRKVLQEGDKGKKSFSVGLLILGVSIPLQTYPSLLKKRSFKTSALDRKIKSKQDIKLLRRWMISRCFGEKVPEILLIQ